MTARMHDPIMDAAMRKTIHFLNGQCIHVCANPKSLLTCAAHQFRNKSRRSQTSCYLVAPAFELISK